MNMHPRFFAREEIETKAALSENGWTHADNCSFVSSAAIKSAARIKSSLAPFPLSVGFFDRHGVDVERLRGNVDFAWPYYGAVIDTHAIEYGWRCKTIPGFHRQQGFYVEAATFTVCVLKVENEVCVRGDRYDIK
jgi:hypothetical protein